jgi:hypothetical protein
MNEHPHPLGGQTAQVQIGEVAINPTWTGHLIAISDHGDSVLFTINHPRLGPVKCLYPRSQAARIRDWLILALQQPVLLAGPPTQPMIESEPQGTA